MTKITGSSFSLYNTTSHSKDRRDNLSSRSGEGSPSPSQGSQQSEHCGVLTTNTLTNEMPILSKDTRTSKCHQAWGPNRSIVIYTPTRVTSPKPSCITLRYKYSYISFSNCKRQNHQINHEFPAVCFWTTEGAGKCSSFQWQKLF